MMSLSEKILSEPIQAKVASSIITAEHIIKRYETKQKTTLAIDDVSIEVLENEFVCIVGTSGCGKSTLLRMLAGLDFPSEGTIVIKDRQVLGPGPDRGMVFQTYTLFPWMTVAENIAYGLKEQGATKEEQEKTVEKYLDVMRLKNFRDAYPKELSGGMKQRVAIARALATKPELILMDEPSAALDPKNRRNLIEILRGLPCAMLIASHDLDFIYDTCDRVVLLYEGRIAADGPAEEILHDGALLSDCDLELPLRFQSI